MVGITSKAMENNSGALAARKLLREEIRRVKDFWPKKEAIGRAFAVSGGSAFVSDWINGAAYRNRTDT